MASSNAAAKCVRWVVAGWTGFVCENLVLSENRSWIIEQIGDAKYHTLYNTLSTIACGSVAFGYLRYGPGRILNNTGLVRSAVALTTASIGAIGLSQLLPTFQVPIGGNGEVCAARLIFIAIKILPMTVASRELPGTQCCILLDFLGSGLVLCHRTLGD